MIKPEDIGHQTDLDREYAIALKNVKNQAEFGAFLQKYDYWLDDVSRSIKSEDWPNIKPLLDDIRKDKIIPEEKHEAVIMLAMPAKIFTVSIYALQFKVPWGTAYIKLRELGKIDY